MLWTLKDVRCFLWIESEAQKGLLNAHTSMVMSSTIISNSAFHCHNQTSLTTLAHKLHLFSACNCTLLVLGYHLHLPLHGTFLLPQNFVECPVGKSVLQLVSSKGSHEHGGRESVRKPVNQICIFFGIRSLFMRMNKRSNRKNGSFLQSETHV